MFAIKIYDVLPDNIWRLRHLLIYKNGLACPSELNHLKWSDIDWENQTMLIHKQKTKINRKAFIMDAVMPILEAVYDAAPEGQVYVVPSLTNTHMARMYHRFQIKADVNDWNCIFISLRKSAVQDAYTWAQQIGLESHVARVSCDRPLVWSHEGRQ
ncbi:tyrosine-type recombinase/integrase [Pirellulales bacterium]|nr:tyrosine-type recombinase/integrase [Pirellulales bacterium]